MKKALNRIVLRITLCALLCTSLKLSATTIKREFRAVWVSTVYCLDWPRNSNGNALQGQSSTIVAQQKERLCQIFDSMKMHGFNAIFFQVRPMSDALYKSSMEPISSYLTGTRGSSTSWDPLEYAVAEAHKRGLELHAWVNPYRWAGSATVDWNTPWDNQIKAKGWILTTDKGKILNPGIVDVRNHIVDVCKEIITNYDVDGLVFDDYFYNSGTPEDETAGDYTIYKNSGTTLSIADWRRNNVNQMVKAVYNMIQANKPYIRFGISPAGVASKGADDAGIAPYVGAGDWQYDGIYSDPLAWLSKGIVDYISPQLYWPTTHSTILLDHLHVGGATLQLILIAITMPAIPFHHLRMPVQHRIGLNMLCKSNYRAITQQTMLQAAFFSVPDLSRDQMPQVWGTTCKQQNLSKPRYPL